MNCILTVFIAGILCLFSVHADARGIKGIADVRVTEAAPLVREGDLVFQSLRTSQSLAIQLATRSEYTHCGVVLFKNGRPYVYEAIQTVSWTPLEDWIRRGAGHHYVLMRMFEPLGNERIATIKQVTGKYEGKPYDLRFQWSDDAIYCSELIWKMYDAAGITLVPLKTFRDYDLDHEEVQKKIRERYGYDISLEEKVIAPSDLMESPLLTVVK